MSIHCVDNGTGVLVKELIWLFSGLSWAPIVSCLCAVTELKRGTSKTSWFSKRRVRVWKLRDKLFMPKEEKRSVSLCLFVCACVCVCVCVCV